jgi:hypothetical protein
LKWTYQLQGPDTINIHFEPGDANKDYVSKGSTSSRALYIVPKQGKFILDNPRRSLLIINIWWAIADTVKKLKFSWSGFENGKINGNLKISPQS